jgi:hypothetical protein
MTVSVSSSPSRKLAAAPSSPFESSHDALVGVDSRDEQDGDLPPPLGCPDPPCRLEPVHPRHLNVDQDDRKPVLKDVIERLGPRKRLEELGADGLENRPQRQQVRGRVVDQ